jgi:hypothetical protein
MLRFIPILFALFCLTGCIHTETECSDILQETVKVQQLIYVPSTHGMGFGPTMSSNGNSGLAVTSIETQEEYAIVFACQHGNFIIKRENLWKKVHQDSSYTCLYREIYETSYDDRKFVGRALKDYDFIGLKEFPDLIQDKYKYRH